MRLFRRLGYAIHYSRLVDYLAWFLILPVSSLWIVLNLMMKAEAKPSPPQSTDGPSSITVSLRGRYEDDRFPVWFRKNCVAAVCIGRHSTISLNTGVRTYWPFLRSAAFCRLHCKKYILYILRSYCTKKASWFSIQKLLLSFMPSDLKL